MPAEAPARRFYGAAALFARRQHRGPTLGLVGHLSELHLLVGQVDLEVGRAGIDEDQVAGEVEEVGRAREDRLGDLGQGAREEVHGRVGGV
jgi:hypothetical protein